MSSELPVMLLDSSVARNRVALAMSSPNPWSLRNTPAPWGIDRSRADVVDAYCQAGGLGRSTDADTTKVRQAGFPGFRSTPQALAEVVARYRAARLIP